MTGEMLLPPRLTTDEGELRRIGVEVEFAGLSCARAAEIVRDLFGGEIRERDPYRFEVSNSRYGSFTVELDTQFAHPDGDGDADEPRRSSSILEDMQDLLRSVREQLCYAYGDVSSAWLPVEIVSPPVPIEQLPELDRIIAALQQENAEGTDDALVYAFATQFNPEVPSLTAGSILRHLKAFLLLASSLRRRIDLDPIRQMLPFADPFPRDYAAMVVDPAYQPDLDQLIDDYVAANPTRNRELDMLPLFAHLRPGRIKQRLQDKLVKARPTFHYRLPDTRLSDPSWGLVTEWNRWVEVERLAADEPALSALGAAFPKIEPAAREAWIATVDTWREQRAHALG